MEDGLDYDVTTKVTFRLDFDGNGELNLLALPGIQQNFASHVEEVYKRNEMNFYVDNLNFQFNGRIVELSYIFSCHDENEVEAESFSRYCVKSVQDQLEEYGCKLLHINCSAEEADMTWLDQLEDSLFGPQKS